MLEKEQLLDILAPISEYLSIENLAQIETAWSLRCDRLQQKANAYVFPKDMIKHGLELLRLLVQSNADPDAISVGLLWEPAVEKLLSAEEISQLISPHVSRMCGQIVALPMFSFAAYSQDKDKEPRTKRKADIAAQAEVFRRMLLALASDLRLMLVLLVLRLHQLRLLEFIPIGQQCDVARECRDIYAPLANRLGISWMKNDFEDLSLRYLYPNDFYALVSKIAAKRNERESYIEEVQKILQDLIQANQISGQVTGRSKHLNSILRKLHQRQINYEQLYDVIAFRVICNNKEACYQVLGLVHDKWKPIPGRFKDYIGLPKSNMYQSLHTTVIGPRQKRMEIQIRTEEMHRIAEDGIAAHWIYKEGGANKGIPADDIHWLRSLLRLQDEKGDADAFMANVRDHLFDSKVFVFTPTGEVKELRRNSTPLDFAYAIHSKVGHHYVGAKVNDKIVALGYELKNGDMVEILTSPLAHPNRGWLEHAQTSRALNKIRSYLRSEQRDSSIAEGRVRLEKELPSDYRSITRLRNCGKLDKALQHFGISSADELLAQIGFGQMNPASVVRYMFAEEENTATGIADAPQKIETVKVPSGSILVEDSGDILVHIARCCNPIPGDPIIGFISRGRGIIVHTKTCSRLHKTDIHRRIAVRWNDCNSHKHSVSLRVVTENRQSIMTQITHVFDSLKLSIARSKCRSAKDEIVNIFRCQISDIHQLERLTRQLSDIRGVIRVERIRQ
jgi:GTP pyrophosphokinase